MRFRIARDGEEKEIEATQISAGRYRITCEGKAVEIGASVAADGTIAFEWGGGRVLALGYARGGGRHLRVDGSTYGYEVARGTRSHGAGHDGDLSSPAPGVVAEIRVAAGDLVHKGDTLVVLESMKMFFPVLAPRDARVGRILCAPRQTVPAGVPLVELVPEGEEGARDGGHAGG